MNNKPIVLVLAGGSGKRWWPLVTYKPLVSFMGKTVLALTLERLVRAGLAEAVIVTRPDNQKEIEKVSVSGIKTSLAVQKESDGMGAAVLAAKEHIKGRPCLVVNASDLVEESYYDRLKTEMKRGEPFIPGRKMTEYFDTGYLKFEGDRVVAIVEKPGKGSEPSQYSSLVFDFFPNVNPFLDTLEETFSERDDVFERALSTLLTKEVFRVVNYDGFWVPMKYPWHVLDYMSHRLDSLKPYRGKNVTIKSNVTIEGSVWFGDNVKVFENTKIVGPCYIGDNTIVGNNTMIRASHIGGNCITGFNTDITRSYIGDNCWFHASYVGDSVLEGNVSVGSGTVLANLRLDEGDIFSVAKGERLNTKRNKFGAIIAKNVRVGVNTSVMPGVKIGTNSFIGAGLTLDRDIPENTFCYGKSQLVMKKNERRIAPGARDNFRKKI